jgi:RNA polymerase sigma-70 factor, ECF subfamily
MTPPRAATRLAAFQAARKDLVALAYRMLGDMGRAEDVVQEAWLHWEGHSGEVKDARAYLVTIVIRLCLNELKSARVRREESRSDRLPEPVELEAGGLSDVVRLDQISMAFLVVLQRLSPAERAVLLLHDVFDFEHREIGAQIGRSVPACRKLLQRARDQLAEARRTLPASPDEHLRLLQAFLAAASSGNVAALVKLLADDAILITDGGAEGRETAGLRNLPRPLRGAAGVASFIAAATARGGRKLQVEERVLNGQPALVFWSGAQPFAALLLAVADGRIQNVFFHADLSRLRHLGNPSSARALPLPS